MLHNQEATLKIYILGIFLLEKCNKFPKLNDGKGEINVVKNECHQNFQCYRRIYDEQFWSQRCGSHSGSCNECDHESVGKL